jgi:hypothetical protein
VDAASAVGTKIYVGLFLRGFGGVPVIARMRVAWTKPADEGHLVGLSFLAEGGAQRDSVERMRGYLAERRRELLGVPA